jgi:hypothetical protein
MWRDISLKNFRPTPVHEIAAEMEESPTEPTKSINQSIHRQIKQPRGSTSTQPAYVATTTSAPGWCWRVTAGPQAAAHG